MGLLEEALRETLAAQAATAPAVEEAATRAIGRARRLRRRRSTFAAAAVVISLALVGAGVAGAGRSPGGDVALEPVGPEIDAWTVALPADVLAGNRIALAMGPVISLADLPPARQAWRVSGGWLVRTAEPPGSAVWFVGQSGTKTRLAAGEQVAVGRSAGGTAMVAWGGGGQVSVAPFADGVLGTPAATGGTGGLSPREIVAGGVLLGEGPEGGLLSYDMWFPDQGGYAPGARSADPVVGVAAFGARVFGLIGLRHTCLALLEPAGFGVVRSRCDLDLGPGDVVSASPDGRWLVTLSRNGVDLYDFESVWRSPAPVANWDLRATGVAWLADGSFIVVEENRVVRLRAGAPDREEVAQVSLTGDEALTGIADLRD